LHAFNLETFLNKLCVIISRHLLFNFVELDGLNRFWTSEIFKYGEKLDDAFIDVIAMRSSITMSQSPCDGLYISVAIVAVEFLLKKNAWKRRCVS